MEETTKILVSKVDLSLPYFDMIIKFLEDCENDKELDQMFGNLSNDDLLEEFDKIKKCFYSIQTNALNKRIIFDKFINYNDYGIGLATTNDGAFIIFNSKMGIVLSKTSYNKFIKIFDLNEIDRRRLYCMNQDHVPIDDDFIPRLREKGIKWKPINIEQSVRTIKKYPKLSS